MRLLFRWIGRLILCAIILFLLTGIAAYFLNKASELPSIEKAPWAIQTYSNDDLRTPSRIYFASDVEIRDDGTPVAVIYWSYDGERYKKHKGEKAFPESEYGTINIIRRATR